MISKQDIAKLRDEIKREKESITKPAKKIIDILRKDDTYKRFQIAVEVGKHLHTLHYSDEERTLDNFIIDCMIDGIVQAFNPILLEQINFVRDHQLEKEKAYGDIDYVFKKIFLSNDVDVFTVKNNPTCSDENYWIIINDKKKEKLHIRLIYENSDYPRSEYPSRLSLRFYKDRNWNMEYIDKYQMTKLGRVYGDIRDKGYVLSFSYSKYSIYECDRNSWFLSYQRNFIQTFHSIYYSVCEEIKKRNIK